MRTFTARPSRHRRAGTARTARELAAGDLLQVHLVGTVDEVQRARVRVHRRERPVVGDAGAAEQLDGAVDHVGREPRPRRP